METPKNLLKGYIGESLAISRYQIYSSIAEAEKFIYVAKYFREVIENEKKHAEIFANFIKKLEIEPAEVEVKAPIKFGSTAENLRYAVEGRSGRQRSSTRQPQKLLKRRVSRRWLRE